VRYAICNELFADRPLAQGLDLAAQMGYDGVELAPFTFAPDGVDRLAPGVLPAIRSQARAAGLEVVGLHWLLVGPAGLHLTSRDRQVRARTSAYLAALVDCCAELGGRVLVLGSPKQRNLPPGMDPAEGLDLAAETLAPAVERARAAGVRWCLEPLPAADTNFLHTLDECLELDRRLGGGPALGVQLDVKSLCAEAADPVHPAEVLLAHAAAAGRFAHFHANDRNLGAPGSGDIDFRPLFSALHRLGYTGWISVEVFDTRAGAEAIARGSLEYLRRAEAEAGARPSRP
jgi:sugar phosphate isomerase/epimerase